MTNEVSSAHIEIDIHRLLSSGEPLEGVIQQLVKNYSQASLSQNEIEALAIFFLHAGYYQTVCEFLGGCLNRNLKISWPHFCEALFLSSPAIPDLVKTSIIQGAESEGQLDELARSTMLDLYDERLPDLRGRRQEVFKRQLLKRREEILSTLKVLRAQGLKEEEARHVEKAKLIFPKDEEINSFQHKEEQKRSRELVQEINPRKRNKWVPLAIFQPVDPETKQVLACIEISMDEILIQSPNEKLALDFAIAHIMWENYPAALYFIERAFQRSEHSSAETLPHSHHDALEWLRLEVLVLMRRFLEALEEIAYLEAKWNQNPDAIFGLMYVRAQCLWELSQHQQAIDIMDSILTARPNYRSARIFLAEWKGETL